MARPSRIYVIAGVNGAGKSSIAGAMFRSEGGDYYNPDEAARRLMAANPRLPQSEANARAWQRGRDLLEQSIDKRLDFAFETTLGGNTITRILAEAAARGAHLYVWYVGLSNLELHIRRVRERVRKGGHDIPEETIRRRFEHSRRNLIALLPALTALRMYDNSTEADPAAGKAPRLTPVLLMEHRKILNPADLPRAPDWAKPIVAAAIRLARPQMKEWR
ncbi:MAG TPA: zeta toxin family protein [Burkholderiales bacterium]|nr:zeta toxin family protein [Burkholderiales bacterium]